MNIVNTITIMIGLFGLVLSTHLDKPTLINEQAMTEAKNVLGGDLSPCCFQPKTGWYRDGYCRTDLNDFGVHTVCAIMTDEFLSYTSKCGNDLSTPQPAFRFPGLKAGDKWCLCVSRWKDAMEAGVAPPIILESCHEKSLEVVSLEDLKRYAK